jgi:phage terminase large subunit-like protein
MSLPPDWSTACPDWEARIVERRPLIGLKPLFQESADAAEAVFGALTMVDVAGEPTMAEAMQPWAKEIVRAIFGAYEPETGRRHINEFFLCVSKKNGKSILAAGIMLTALVMNWRKSGEYIILAPTKEIADNSFKPIRDMIKADDELKALLQVQEHIRTVTHRTTQATLKVVAADSDTVSGKKAIGVFVDELHEFGSRQHAENMLLEATGGLTSRPEGFVIYATTQSSAAPAGVFKQKLDYARGVRDGRILDRTFLPVIYEFPKAMLQTEAHRDFSNAYVTNPNWGVSVDQARIEKLRKQAEEQGEESFRLFLAKHLNVEIGLRLMAGRWPGADHWEGAARVESLESLIERSDVITMGIDGGGLDDWLAAAVLGRDADTGCWLHWGRAWIHPVALERRKAEAERWRDFIDQGDLVLVERIGQDIEGVVAVAQQLDDSGLLTQVGVDPIGISDIEAALIDVGIEQDADGKDRIVGIPQGYKLSGTINTVARRLVEGSFAHTGQPVMAWTVGNAKVEARGNAVIVTKQAAGACKIDLLVALFNAAALMALAPEPNVCTDDEVLAA